MKKELIIITGLVLLAGTGLAQPADMKPGITPDSPFYFMDRAFDRFQSRENVADEKAGEIMAMAEENKGQAMSKAENSYSRAMERRLQNIGRDADGLEQAVQQTARHMESFSRATNNSDQTARKGLQIAMNNSARDMGSAFQELNQTDPDRANRVAEQTIQRVMKDAPEEAQKGLQTAFRAVQGQMPAARGRMDNGSWMPENAGPEGSTPGNGQEQNGMETGDSSDGNTSDNPDQPVSSNASD